MQNLESLREEISRIDAEIIQKLAQRQKLVLEVGKIKADNALAITDNHRESQLFAYYEKLSQQYGLSADFVKQLFDLVISYSRRLQEDV